LCAGAGACGEWSGPGGGGCATQAPHELPVQAAAGADPARALLQRQRAARGPAPGHQDVHGEGGAGPGRWRRGRGRGVRGAC